MIVELDSYCFENDVMLIQQLKSDARFACATGEDFKHIERLLHKRDVLIEHTGKMQASFYSLLFNATFIILSAAYVMREGYDEFGDGAVLENFFLGALVKYGCKEYHVSRGIRRSNQKIAEKLKSIEAKASASMYVRYYIDVLASEVDECHAVCQKALNQFHAEAIFVIYACLGYVAYSGYYKHLISVVSLALCSWVLINLARLSFSTMRILGDKEGVSEYRKQQAAQAMLVIDSLLPVNIDAELKIVEGDVTDSHILVQFAKENPVPVHKRAQLTIGILSFLFHGAKLVTSDEGIHVPIYEVSKKSLTASRKKIKREFEGMYRRYSVRSNECLPIPVLSSSDQEAGSVEFPSDSSTRLVDGRQRTPRDVTKKLEEAQKKKKGKEKIDHEDEVELVVVFPSGEFHSNDPECPVREIRGEGLVRYSLFALNDVSEAQLAKYPGAYQKFKAKLDTPRLWHGKEGIVLFKDQSVPCEDGKMIASAKLKVLGDYGDMRLFARKEMSADKKTLYVFEGVQPHSHTRE